MDFGFDAAQQVIAQLSAEAMAEPDPWKALGETGMLALGLPARYGGEGLGMAETAIVLTEVGRNAAQLPALATLALGVLPVARFAPEAVQDELLTGGRLLTAAFPNGDVAHGVPYATSAHRILAQTAGGIAVYDPAGLSITPMATSSGGPEAVVHFGDAHPESVFAGDLTYYALAGGGALGDGLIRGALDLTTGHVRTRQQFGKPLATFQAVAQQIADVYIAWRTSHLTALAACADESGADLAAEWLAREGPPAMRTCHHLHGGIGLDVSYPLHRYPSMLKDLLRLMGSARAHRA